MEGFLLSFSAVSPEKVYAYKAADYYISDTSSDFIIRIGVSSEKLRQLHHGTGQNCSIYITAFNPYGAEQNSVDNRSAHVELEGHLRKISPYVFEGFGTDPAGIWAPEASFLALGIDLSTSKLLGKRFKQDAVVWVGADAVPQLIILR